MANRLIEFLTESQKDARGLGKLLIKALPSIGFDYNRKSSYLFGARYPRFEEANYIFADKKTKQPAIIYKYKLDKDIYRASLDLNRVSEEAYGLIISVAEEGFPRLFRQKVA